MKQKQIKIIFNEKKRIRLNYMVKEQWLNQSLFLISFTKRGKNLIENASQ